MDNIPDNINKVLAERAYSKKSVIVNQCKMKEKNNASKERRNRQQELVDRLSRPKSYNVLTNNRKLNGTNKHDLSHLQRQTTNNAPLYRHDDRSKDFKEIIDMNFDIYCKKKCGEKKSKDICSQSNYFVTKKTVLELMMLKNTTDVEDIRNQLSSRRSGF